MGSKAAWSRRVPLGLWSLPGTRVFESAYGSAMTACRSEPGRYALVLQEQEAYASCPGAV
jgi:hypothetical protein